jgi:predicted dehydrogenase
MMKRRRFLQSLGSGVLAGPLANIASARDEPTAAPTDRQKIKVGQIGTAHAHAAGKMSTLRKLGHLYEVVGIVEPDAKQRRRAEQQEVYRGLSWLSEDELLHMPGLTAVAVETEVRDLVPVARRAVDAGFHVHLDKPPGESLGEFRDLLEAAVRGKRVVQLGYMFRYNPAFQAVFRAVREGWLGDIFEVHGVMSKKIDRHARENLLPYRGGSMFELGCHLIDAMVTVLGRPKRVTAFPRQTRPGMDELADNGLAVFEYPRTTATIRSAVVEVDGFARRQFVVCGTGGTAEIRPLEPASLKLTLERPCGPYQEGAQVVALAEPAGRYDGDFLDLAQMIHGEKQPDFTAEHDLAVHEAVLLASGLPLESA